VVATAVLLAWRKSRIWLLVALVALPLLAAAMAGVAWMALPAVRERFGAVLESPEKASGIRISMWRDAPAMFRDRPVWGFGGGSYVWAYPPYQVHVRHHLNWDYAHNEYIQHLLEYGAVGLGLALAALVACAWGLVRGVLLARSRTGAFLLAGAAGGLVASLVHALFDFNFHIFPNPHVLVWMGGVAWGVWFAHERGLEPCAGRRRTLRWVASAAGACACAGCAWLALSGGLSYAWNLKAEIARTQMDWDSAVAAYQRSIRWDGWNWQPHLGLGNLHSTQALWARDPDPAVERELKAQLADEAAAHYRRAAELNACDMAVVFGLGRIAQARGDSETALEHFRHAASYQRRHIFYREQLGIQLRAMGRDAEALEVFRQNMADRVATDVSRSTSARWSGSWRKRRRPPALRPRRSSADMRAGTGRSCRALRSGASVQSKAAPSPGSLASGFRGGKAFRRRNRG
jgi:tetratricopeptide (TPR) repeat protein